MAGQGGADIILFGRGDGQDLIVQYDYTRSVADSDTIQFRSGVAPTDVTITRVDSHLVIKLNDTDDQIRVGNYFYQSVPEIASIKFDDGTVWTVADVRRFALVGTEGADTLTGYADAPTLISAGDGNDTLYGGGGNLGGVLAGGAGDDRFVAGEGHYTLNGESGDDYMSGGSGQDTLSGGTGNDYLFGSAGDDLLDGGAGNDQLEGAEGNDTYFFGRGSGQDIVNNRTYVSAGFFSDTIRLGANLAEADLLLTRSTDDLRIAISGTDDSLTITNYFRATDSSYRYGVDSIVFSDNTTWDAAAVAARLTTIVPTAGITLSGTSGDDTLAGTQGNDSLSGGEGNDTLDGQGGDDTLDGGFGTDTYLFGRASGKDQIVNNSSSTDPDIVGLAANVAPADVSARYDASGSIALTITGTSARLSRLDQVSEVRFSNGTVWNQSTLAALGRVATEEDDFLFGGSTADSISAGAGDDWVDGRTGNDTLDGGSGDDVVLGDAGDDVVRGGTGADGVEGGLGNDVVFGDTGNDRLYGGEGSDRLDGGAGDDQVSGGGGADVFVFGRLSGKDTLQVDTLDTIELAPGLLPADVTVQRDNNDLLLSIAGTSASQRISYFFYLDGGSLQGLTVRFEDGTVWNVDTLKRMAMTGLEDTASTLIGYATNDVITGQSQNDQLYGRLGDDTIDGGTGEDTLYGEEGNDLLRGGTQVDTLYGGAGDDLLLGQDGNDSLYGEAGDDTLDGGAGRDNVVGGDGADTLRGGEGSDSLNGGAGHDVLAGGTGRDILDGLDGNDILDGGLGDDLLFGRDGSDTFLFGRGDGRDVIRSGATGSARFNTIAFKEGVSHWDVTTRRITNEVDALDALELRIAGTGDVIIVERFFAGGDPGNASNPVQQVRFADGTVWDLQTLANLRNTQLVVGTDAADVLNGTGAAERVRGLDGDDSLNGGGGDDWLDGGAGSDRLSGGLGNDIYAVDSAADRVAELADEGTDTVQASVDWTLGANLENLRLTGSALRATGNGLGNQLFGNDADNVLEGGAGLDTLAGGSGNDTYVVDDAVDTVVERGAGGTDTVLSSVSWILSDEVENLTLTGAATINATGNALANTLTGNSAANRLDGAGGADVMAGAAGDDVYVVNDAADVITEYAGDGIDTVETSIAWTLGAHQENLVMTGLTDWLWMTGNELNNRIVGHAGQNILDGGAGADVLIGGAGLDNYYIDNVGDAVIEDPAAGTDSVYSSVSWTLSANVENLTLTGTAATAGTGNELGNSLYGNGANNVLDGGLGNDWMNGGAGDDTYMVESANDGVIEAEGQGTDTIVSSVSLGLGSNVERLVLSGTAAITGTGNSLNNEIVGNAAGNALSGGSGNDILDGGAGADAMTGGTGNDTYVVDNAADTTIEAASGGADIVQSSITWTLATQVENLTLTGTSAIDGTGNTQANVLRGNAANNVLSGGSGSDTMIGGAGNDTYVVDATGDVVTEGTGEGLDLVQASVTHTLLANVENLTLMGSTAISGTGNALANVLTGNSAANTLTGADGNDTLDGGAGNDTMAGGAGDDTYFVDSASDVTNESASAGTDTVIASVTRPLGANLENLTLSGSVAINGTGNALANTLVGNVAANTLAGLDGADIYDGGAGNDALTDASTTSGDTYRFGIGYGTDTITDAGGTDSVVFGTGITAGQVSFAASGNNLRVSITGQSDVLIVSNWYASTANRVEQFRLSDGTVLSPSLIPATNTASVTGTSSQSNSAVATTFSTGSEDSSAEFDAVLDDSLWASPLMLNLVGRHGDTSTGHNWWGGFEPLLHAAVVPPSPTLATSAMAVEVQALALVHAMAAFGSHDSGAAGVPWVSLDRPHWATLAVAAL